MKNNLKKTVSYMCLGLIGASLVPRLSLGDSRAQSLQGVVSFAAPVSHATIKVVDRGGNILVTQADATNEDGYFSISLPEGTKAYRVEALNGQIRGGPLEGTLFSTVTDENLMHLNAATTLSSYYQDLNPAVSVIDADQRVRNYLGLPALLDSGFSFENPYLMSFSPQTLLIQAQANGGLDRYLPELALEMSKDANAVREFPAAGGLQAGFGPAWIGEKLLAGVVGAVGSQLFSKFMDGIGFPDQTTQIYNLLNQVMARLTEIQNSLVKIEQSIKQANYDIRASALWKEYREYTTLVKQISETNVIAKANMDAQGKPKDPVVAANVKKAAQTYIDQLIGLRLKFVSNVNAELMTEGTITPLTKVFAEVKWLDGNIIDAKYFNAVFGQLEQYRSFQAVATALLIDAERAVNPVMAEADLKTALSLINEEKVTFPNEALFNAPTSMNGVIDGSMIFDRASGLLWMTKYVHTNSCEELMNLYKNPKKYYPGSIDQIGDLLVHAKINGYRWSDAAKTLGFSAQEADGTTMITQVCVYTPMTGNLYQWFGNDRQGPFSAFLDQEGQYNGVRADKKVKGIYTMIAAPLQ